MPSYRFCRPDDIPLLVHAVETCYRVHDPGEPEWTADSFRRGMREIDLWPSNSMVALDTDGEPLAVMIGTKRPEEVAVHRLGVRPDHLRQGHGQHLLTSLSQKLAVLGPERLVAEVPDERKAALACFAAAGYTREATLVDWWRPFGVASEKAVPEGLVSDIAVADLEAAGLLAETPSTAWCRSRRSLVQSGDRLRGAAVVSPDRIEAWIVFDPPPAGEAEPPEESGLDRAPDPVPILAVGGADPARLPLLFGVLVRWLAARAPGRGLLVPRLAPEELASELLAAHGFSAGGASARLAATATPL
ncbi:MAG TPA: GNAT family N-acetyltransferase [Thermoanaerobaculia bacterium]|nr:GNAT family N-acetyltransferase [Thermoanaerobaculia bacterium]